MLRCFSRLTNPSSASSSSSVASKNSRAILSSLLFRSSSCANLSFFSSRVSTGNGLIGRTPYLPAWSSVTISPLMTGRDQNVSFFATKAGEGKEKKALPKKGDQSAKTVEEMYQRKTPIEHVLLRPDTYVGSLEQEKVLTWLFNYKTKKMERRNCNYVPGLYKIFDEILVNAADNRQRDPKGTTRIKVRVDTKENLISVYNNGKGIPVTIHKEEGIYVPELVFGNLLTSSNFDDSLAKVTGGRNGYGAKLANIFSKEFTIETVDSANGKKYSQTWRNNMSEREEPIVSEAEEGEKDYTQVIFRPDLERFGLRSLRSSDTANLFARRVLDIAACCGDVEVYLNNQRVPVSSFHDYISLFFSSTLKSTSKRESQNEEESETSDDDGEVQAAKESREKEDGVVVVQSKINARWEIGVGLSPTGQFEHVSFVNGISTTRGGTHVNLIAEQIVAHLKSRIISQFKQELSDIPAALIRNHLFLFVNCLIENPAFDSQTKETLTTKPVHFGSTCELPKSFLKRIVEETGIVDQVVEWQRMKERSKLNAASRKVSKGQIMGIEKLDDAPLAGTKRWSDCTLILTEGDSAKSLAVAGLSVIGRDRYGVFPLKGKLLNVRNASVKQMMANTELTDIKTILGLNHDQTYEIDPTSSSEEKPLRYGKVMLMTDQDHDGAHIKGLFINFVHHFWPALVKKSNFLQEFVTPIIKASKGSTTLSFFSIPQYEAWRKSILQEQLKLDEKGKASSESDDSSQQLRGWKIKYYKGLGTSTAVEAKEYFSNLKLHRKQFQWKGEEDDKSLDLAFGKSEESFEKRKNWLRETRSEDSLVVDHTKPARTVSDFVRKEIYLYSMADNLRSIPSVVDGLKPSQRKVLYACFKRKWSNNEEIKVTQLAGYVSEQTSYHHGEASLQSTITNLAQTFVGSNNLAYLLPIGQFGTRLQGGDDAASARYIYTKPASYTRLLFHPEDDGLLKQLNDDGFPIQPEFYVPVIPAVLLNGCQGIGAGWSTNVPPYNPLDIIDNLLRHLDSQPFLPMTPWWRGFTGRVQRADAGTFITFGAFERKSKTQLVISELPIGKWTTDYKVFLEKMRESKVVKSFSEHHTEQSVRFVLELRAGEDVEGWTESEIIKKFKLSNTVSLNNMHLFTAQGIIKKYSDPLEILSDFVPLRMEFYEKRKKRLERKLEEKLVLLQNSHRFYELIQQGKLSIVNRKKADLVKELESFGFTKLNGTSPSPSSTPTTSSPNDTENNNNTNEKEAVGGGTFDYLLGGSLWSLTNDSLVRLSESLKSKTEELNVLRSKTPNDLWKEDLLNLREVLLSELAVSATTIQKKKKKEEDS